MALLPGGGPRRRRRRSDLLKLPFAPRHAEITPVDAAFAAIRPGRYSTAAGSPRDEHPASTLAAAVFEMPLGGCQPLQPARRAATVARDVNSCSALISDAAAATLVAPAIVPVSIVLLQRWADGRGNHLETRHNPINRICRARRLRCRRQVKCRGDGCLRLARGKQPSTRRKNSRLWLRTLDVRARPRAVGRRIVRAGVSTARRTAMAGHAGESDKGRLRGAVAGEDGEVL